MKEKFIIGRELDADIKIRSLECSRKQARICWMKKGESYEWVILDGEENTHSANGTWLNLRTLTEKKYGMASKKCTIQNGSVFRFGGIIATVMRSYHFDVTNLFHH